MSRSKTKNTIMIEDWRKIKLGKLYKGIIKKAVVNSKHLHVVIENLDNSQLGRLHDIVLPLPVRPGSRTGRFLIAAGLKTNTVGKQIYLDDIVDIFIGMRFSAADGSDKEIEYKRIQPVAEDETEDSVIEQEDQTLL